jgi:MFS family permease
MASLAFLGRSFSALAEPRMRRYLGAQAASLLGSWVLDITLNLLVWRLTRSPVMLGALNFLIYLPSLVVTPLLSGRLSVDNARRVSLAVLAAAMTVAVALALGNALGLLTLPVLMGAALVRGVLGGMEVPSCQMLLMNLTHDSVRLASAIALNTVVFLIARTLGPALAGLMFEPWGPGAGFVLAALGTAVMWRNVASLPRAPRVPPVAPAPVHEGGMRAALRFVWQDGFGRLFLPLTACVAFCSGAYQTLVPVLADRAYGSASTWTGWFFGAGGLAGWGRWWRRCCCLPATWMQACAAGSWWCPGSWCWRWRCWPLADTWLSPCLALRCWGFAPRSWAQAPMPHCIAVCPPRCAAA